MSNVSTLNVLFYGELIATITHVAMTEHFLPLRGGLITNFKPTQTKLTLFFSNLLPEETMRNYLAERAGVNPAREFFLLWVLGQNLAGAITVMPADGEALPPNEHEEIEEETKQEAPIRFSLAGVQLKFSAV